MLMDILIMLAGLWFIVFALIPIQIAHELGPFWTVVLVLLVIVVVRHLFRWRRDRQVKRIIPSHRKH